MIKPQICEDEECGREFTPVKAGTRFCCSRCNLRTYRRKKAAKLASTAIPAPCDGPGCTKILARQPSGIKEHNFCSRACQIAWRQATQEPRVCVFCGKEFTPHFTKPDQQCCSKRCAMLLNDQKRLQDIERRREYMALLGDRDVASEILAQVPYSALWRGKGMTSAYQPLGNFDVCVGY